MSRPFFVVKNYAHFLFAPNLPQWKHFKGVLYMACI